MQASRYYLVLTYPEGQYDGSTLRAKRMVMVFSHTLMATDMRVNGAAISFGALAPLPGQMVTDTRASGHRIRRMVAGYSLFPVGIATTVYGVATKSTAMESK